jgi:tetratricopeptide (TPR) repeat protein
MRSTTIAACVLSAAFCLSQQVRKPATSGPPPAARAYYERAGEMARKGDLDGAMAEYKAALKLSPSYADARFFLSVVLAKKGDEKEAIKELRETIRLNPNHAEAHQFLGSTLQHSVARDIISQTQMPKNDTRLDEAIKEDRIAVRLKPESAQTHYWLGSALELQGGHASEAKVELQEALELDPKTAGARDILGRILENEGNLDGAITEYQAELQLSPEDANEALHFSLAQLFDKKGDLESAIAEYRQCDNAQSHFHLGADLEKKGNLNEAILEYREALHFDPGYNAADQALDQALRWRDLGWALLPPNSDLDSTVAKDEVNVHSNANDARAHYDLGIALHQRNHKEAHDPEKAIAEFDSAIRLKPDYAEAHFVRGWTLHQMGTVDDAVGEYREALSLKPDLAYVHVFLGLAIDGKGGNLDGAIVEYRKAEELIPDDPQIHYDVGYSLFRRGDLDGAVAEFRKALELRPMFPEATLRLETAMYQRDIGWAQLQTHDLNGAITQYQQAVSVKPYDAQAHFKLGLAFRERGEQYGDPTRKHWVVAEKGIPDVDSAISELKEALRLQPDNGEAHFALGWALDDRGDMDGAIAEYNEALRLKLERAYVHYRLGWALDTKGDAEAAQHQFDEVLRLQPDYPANTLNVHSKPRK